MVPASLLFLFVLAHVVVISLPRLHFNLSSHPSFTATLFPLPPSFPPSLWQPGLVRCRLPEPRIHVVQGRRWGTWGLGPLAKTTSPAVAWCLPLPTDLSPRYFTLSPKIHLWIIPSFHSSFPLHRLAPKSHTLFLKLKWKLGEILVQLSV